MLKNIRFIMAILTLVSINLAAEEEITITNLERVDEIYLEHKRNLLADLAFKRLDKILRGDKRDIAALQALLDNQVVVAADQELLFAMGVAIGDIYVKELDLHWKNYTDERGKSRAVCIKSSEHCLFPITMVSKRVSRGFKVKISQIYDRGVDLIDDHFPKLPYSAK